MASAALVITDLGPNANKSIALLADRLSLSISAVRASVDAHSPVIEKRLFDRHDPLFPERLERLLLQLDSLGCRWQVAQVLDGQSWSAREDYYQITIERLRNMIAQREISLEEQRQQGAREDS